MLALAIDQWRLAVAALAIVVTLVVAAHRTPIEGTFRAHAPSVGSLGSMEAISAYLGVGEQIPSADR